MKTVPTLLESQGEHTLSNFSPQTQAAVAKYALLHGNKAAMRRFTKELGKDIKETSVSTWKKKYEAELKRVLDISDDKSDVSVKRLPVKKR